MTSNPFDPTFDQLPGTLPIFPLSGVLLLPRGRLPLNIFEPRYLAMTKDALVGDRMIGMIQPNGAASPPASTLSATGAPPVFATGCAGRITSFRETDDGRYLITLTGVCRFHVVEELAMMHGYRRVMASWDAFRDDMTEETGAGFDRERLVSGLRLYFKTQGISANWDAIDKTPDEKLVTSLSMICPFDATEKQALLEAPCLDDRARLLIALIEMAVLDTGRNGDTMPRH